MIDTSPEGLLSLIKGGESQSVEFKSTCPPDHTVAMILTSFANTDGGILIIGVSGSEVVEGLDDEHWGNAHDTLTKVSASLFQWPIEVGSEVIHGHSVVYAVIDKAPRHYFPVMTSRGELFRRENTEHIPLTPPKDANCKPKMEPSKPYQSIVVFVAMSFREEEEPALVDYFRAIQNAAAATKLPLNISRVDLLDGDYEISQKIMEEIDRAHVVITDFTLNSRNVYFELGYARGRKCRVIQTAKKGTALEFDIRNWRTVFYRNATELEEKVETELETAYRDVANDIN